MTRLPSRAWMLAAVVAVALLVRVIGIDWGLPPGYEEAVPLKTGWQMAGWGEEPLDLNPHFFHYPSLTFYTQLGAQVLLNAGMRATGAVESTREFRVTYYTDPTPFYITGRLVTVAFALLTLVALAALAARSGIPGAGVTAALLLAVNVYHVSRSQMVEVNVPLTALVAVALWTMVRLVESPGWRRSALAGAAVGLAAATKYTGALLLVPLVVAVMLTRTRRWRQLLVAAGAAAAAFVIASPFVVIDFAAFRADLTLERVHMQAGHFGGSDEPAPLFYLRALGGSLVGWLALVLSLAGVIGAAIIHRRPWAVIAAAFVVAYSLVICSWEMVAPRYALPLVPLLLMFALAGVWELATRVTRVPARQAMIVGVGALAMAAGGLGQIDDHRRRMAPDSRSIALEWIETHVAAGSLIVTEAYGPPLFGPLQFWNVADDIRADVYRRRVEGRFRGVLPIPLFQAQPEETAPYYQPRLYDDADVVVTTTAVRTRYQSDPARFPAQNAFYDSLDAGQTFERLHTVPASGDGPRIVISGNRRHTRPFADREPGPVPHLEGTGLPPRWRAWFYYRFGLNHEAFGHLERALESYRAGWPDATSDPETYRQIAYGLVRTVRLLGRTAEVPALVERLAASAPRPEDREFVESLGASVSR